MKTKNVPLLLFIVVLILSLNNCTTTISLPKNSNDDYSNLSIGKGKKVKISKKEKKAWLAAESTNSVNAYKDYLKVYPDGVMQPYANEKIDKAYNRYDELIAIDVKAPDDVNLNRLSTLTTSENPSPSFVNIDIILMDQLTREPFGNAILELQSTNCEEEKRSSHRSDQDGKVSLQIQKGCCYGLLLLAEGTKSLTKQFCTDELNSSSLTFYLERNALLIGSSANPDTVLVAPVYVIYDIANKIYYTSEGALFSGEYEGKIIVNGKENRNALASPMTPDESILIDIDPSQDVLVADAGGFVGTDDNRNGQTTEESDDGLDDNFDRPQFSPIGFPSPPTPTVLSDECALNIKSKGVLAYNNLPREMKIDSSYRLEILINELHNIDEIKKEIEEKTGDTLNTTELVHEGTATVGDQVVEVIRIGSWMRVTLSQPKNQNAFDITNAFESEEENLKGQNIDCDMNAKWKWLITPTKGGDHTLLLNFSLKTDEDSQSWRVLDDIEKKIRVKVEEDTWLSQLMIPGGIGIALLSFFLFWWRSRKKKQDYVFGANLGIAGGLENVATPPAKPKSVFIAYAKEDEEWTKQIYNQMKVLHKGGYVNIWYDQLLEAGVEYKEEIFKHLEESDIIILNISSDFLASDFCDELMKRAMERQQRGEGVVLIPIIVRPCLWATTPLSNVNVFPKNKKPLSDEEWKNIDNAIVNVMTELEAKLLN